MTDNPAAGHTEARAVAKKRIREALDRWHEVGLFETSGEFAGVMEAVDEYATAIRAAIADEIEAACVDPEWPNDCVSRNGAKAAAIARGDQ